jgi:FtsP/CotA-like multicopper oxidase with cupredoxin domain
MTSITRRRFVQYSAVAGASLFAPLRFGIPRAFALPIPGGTLDPRTIPKFATPLVIPPAMPRTSKAKEPGGNKNVDVYEIGVRQFQQHILPVSMNRPTTVWSYGSINHPGSFHYPAFTIEAKWKAPVQVTWMNQLYDGPWGGNTGQYLPHLLAVDQTLHWANPPGGPGNTDRHGMEQEPYTGPVPIVTHLHGGHSTEESDGFAEAWYLPPAGNIPAGYASVGSHYDAFKAQFASKFGVTWAPGSATFRYDNDQDATTMWYHDHSLGMTRSNVYAGPAGFYLLRGGPRDEVTGLPGPAPALGDPVGMSYYEIPIAIQDRSFNDDGSLFYPDNRAFFEGLELSQLQIPFIPDIACDGAESDISPIWNPEFFGNAMVVNGKAWPYLNVEQRRYRFRFLNGCNSRFLILKMSNGLPFWQIGAEGGFLPAPVQLPQLLMGPAERADVIIDFSNVAVGTEIVLLNVGPDEPFGGGEPDEDFDSADAETTGKVMLFRVGSRMGPDRSTPPSELVLPALAPLKAMADVTRKVTLNEADSATVRVVTHEDGSIVLACDDPDAEPFGPKHALLGTLAGDGTSTSLGWDDAITENPKVSDTEVWEIYNFTADAHPIHIHEVMFAVVDRQKLETDEEGIAVEPAVLVGSPIPPFAWETGRKDTVIAYPGEVTRVKALYDRAGLFVWHCHIVEHEDHEMMRPYRVGSAPQ